RPVGVALEQHGAAAQRGEERLGDGLVVPDEVELRGAEPGEEHLVRVGDAHRPAGQLELHGVGHGGQSAGWRAPTMAGTAPIRADWSVAVRPAPPWFAP